jgi:oligopeptide/dipeptide ABC transporter ATP-binding protein
MTVLQVSQLCTSFATEQGRVRVVDDISLTINAGESLGLVGESGCGKSITALSIMRLLPQPHGRIDAGEVLFDDDNLVAISPAAMRTRRGNQMAMIFQEPMTALNPVYTIGRQLQEPFRLHQPDMSKHDRIRRAIDLLSEVGIASPEKRMADYPHQLSGGMRQRVMIAMALALKPKLLIADEPTTALDVTFQAQILALINELRERHGTAVLFITHDLGVIAETCDRVAVMYAGRIVEQANVQQFFNQPRHPYSLGLLNAIPRMDSQPRTRLKAIPGSVPAIDQLGNGCRFFERCQYAVADCQDKRPALEYCQHEQLVTTNGQSGEPVVKTSHSEQQVACLRWREV